MTKKVLFGMAAFTMLFATSCQNELDVISSSGTSTVSFKVETPEIQSRAFSDGTTATVLQYAVYNSKGVELKDLTVTDGEIHGSTTVELQLTTGNSYSVIFWAAADGAPYTVDFANQTMTVDYTAKKTVSNDENRDAFYKYHTFTVNGAQTETIELKRPFAQLNIGTADFEASDKAGYTPTHSSVKVSNVYTTLNFVDGTVSNPTTEDNTITFALATIPAKYDATAKTGEKFPVEGYDYLAMNYLLVAAEKETIEVEYTYTDANNDSKTRTVGSVPVQRNYRTNIYGNLLTSEVDMNVVIKPEYDGTLELDELYKAALNGGTVTLTQDVVLTTPLEVYGNMVIDLNGHTIKNTTDYAIENYGTLTINGKTGGISGLGGIRSHAGHITINGGTYTGSSKWNDTPATYQHILKAEKTEVVINGGVFDATIEGTNNAMINVSTGSKVTINGGEFRNVSDGTDIPAFAPYMFTYEKDGKLIINDGEFYGGWRFNGENATTDIYGGNFTVSYDGQSFNANSTHVLTIYGGTFSLANSGKLNPTNHVAKGYYVNQDGDNYMVNDYILANTTKGLQAALDAATDGATINLKAGVEYGVVYLGRPTKNNATTMFCETHNFTTTDAAAFKAHLEEAGYHTTPRYTTTLKNVTIVGAEGATIAGLVATSGHMYASNGTVHDYVLEVDKSGSGYYNTLHLENIYFKNVAFTGKIDINTSDATSTYDGVTFDGCTFTTGGIASSNGAAIRYYNEANNGNVKNIVVKNSKFNNCYQGVYVQNVNGITVTDSEFDTTGHNAIAMQSTGEDAVNLKNVVIENNTFKNIADRVIRFNYVGADSNITIQYNTATNSGDEEKEVMKATSIATGITTNIGFNNWGADAVIANEELKDKAVLVSTAEELSSAIKNAENVKNIYFANDITVEKWIMFSETLTIGSGQINTVKMDGLTIDGNGHTLTVNSIESASNGNNLFHTATNLNIQNLTIKYADGVAGGAIGLKSGNISKVNFVGGSSAIYPGEGEINVEECTFATNATAIYFEEERDNLTVNKCTFTQPAETNVILLRGDVKFTNNIVNSGRTVNIVSGSPVVTGNDFNNVRLKVYSAATATVSGNIINNLAFEDDKTTYASTFTNNTMSEDAQATLDAMEATSSI